MELKILSWIGNILGLPSFILAVWLNFSNYKSDILFFIGGGFVLVRMFFFILRQFHLHEMRKIELEKERMDLEERKHKKDSPNY